MQFLDFQEGSEQQNNPKPASRKPRTIRKRIRQLLLASILILAVLFSIHYYSSRSSKPAPSSPANIAYVCRIDDGDGVGFCCCRFHSRA